MLISEEQLSVHDTFFQEAAEPFCPGPVRLAKHDWDLFSADRKAAKLPCVGLAGAGMDTGAAGKATVRIDGAVLPDCRNRAEVTDRAGLAVEAGSGIEGHLTGSPLPDTVIRGASDLPAFRNIHDRERDSRIPNLEIVKDLFIEDRDRGRDAGDTLRTGGSDKTTTVVGIHGCHIGMNGEIRMFVGGPGAGTDDKTRPPVYQERSARGKEMEEGIVFKGTDLTAA